jgi:hypothetical protein
MTDEAKALNVPFPLRDGWVATVQVPRDITPEEAGRLADMVRLLGVPVNVELLHAAPEGTGGNEP